MSLLPKPVTQRPSYGITNLSTGETLPLDLSIAPNTEQAYGLHVALGQFIEDARIIRARLLIDIEQDLTARDASERMVDGLLFRRSVKNEYDIDDALLYAALSKARETGEISDEEFIASVQETITVSYKWNNRTLSKLAEKRGGAVREAILKHRRSNPKSRIEVISE